jgi:flagellar biosynthesis/type III secretory pathway protein FliH
MTAEQQEQIEAAIQACEARAVPWTNRSVYRIVGGSYSALARYLKARRAKAGTGMAVLDVSVCRDETAVPAEEEAVAEAAGLASESAQASAVVIPVVVLADPVAEAKAALTQAQGAEAALARRRTELHRRRRETLTELRRLRHTQGQAQDHVLQQELTVLEGEIAALTESHHTACQRLIAAQDRVRTAQGR